MEKLLITNARLINEGEIHDADVLVAGERIEKIDTKITADESVQVLDANGKYLIPGMIDDQVHFREPGLTNKGDLATESAAAVAGGITSFMDMPNVNPQTTTRAALADKYKLAERRCSANYAFYLGATNRNIEEIRGLKVNEAKRIVRGAAPLGKGVPLPARRASRPAASQLAELINTTSLDHQRVSWKNYSLPMLV